MNEPIDWEKLAGDLGLLRENSEGGGSDYAKRAIERLIGEDRLREDRPVERGGGDAAFDLVVPVRMRQAAIEIFVVADRQPLRCRRGITHAKPLSVTHSISAAARSMSDAGNVSSTSTPSGGFH